MDRFNAHPHLAWQSQDSTRQRRPAVDLTGMGVVRSDHWHRDKQLKYVTHNIEQRPNIYFNQEPWVNYGIALSTGMYCHTSSPSIGLSVLDCWPKELQFTEVGVLEIEWPGYYHTTYRAPLTFARDGRPVLFTELISQIASIWYKFFRAVERDAWPFVPPGIPLHCVAPGGVTFAALRLIELYSSDGLLWRCDLGYVSEIGN